MDKYNFDVKEMVDSFSLEDFFISEDNKIEREAFLLITDNQYILGYSKSFGYGEFNEAISNTIREIYGLKNFKYRREIENISDIIKGNFITAKIDSSKRNGIYIEFNINECSRISENQFSLFKDFFDEYNDIIKMYSMNFGYPLVKYYLPNDNTYVNDFGIVNEETCYESDDLTGILEILKTKVDENKVVPEENKIIGNIVKRQVKSKIKEYVI